MTEEVLPAEAARGLQATGYRLQAGESGSGSELEPNTQPPEPDPRVRRYPVGFQFDGEKWVAAQTSLFDLEPLRLVVCDPSEDAVIRLGWGPFDWVFRDWRLPPGASVHSRDLFWPYARVLWKPGELAALDVVSGGVSGAAFVARRIPE